MLLSFLERVQKMELDFNSKIKRFKQYKMLSPDAVLPKAEIHEDYPHLTFYIHSLLEYLHILKILELAKDEQDIVFRGMSNCEWSPIPSLARYNGYDETIEHNMVDEFLSLRPEAFQGLRSNFEILAKMQHHGLPTRILDFTANPLVALYFACEDNPHSDARVLCARTSLTESQDKLVEAICSSCRQTGLQNLRLEDFLESTGVTPYEYLSRLYLLRDSRLLFVRPWYWNQRISNQRAIFLIFPNALHDYLGFLAYYKEEPYDNDKMIINQINEINRSEGLELVYPIWQPTNQVEERLKEWSEKHLPVEDVPPKRDFMVNHITMQRLFSYHSPSDITLQKDIRFDYSEYGQLLFGRRFLLNSWLDSIDNESMKTTFCSIIISKKSKKSILSDLESVGIDKSFVYPELEYTAEKIRKKYFFT